MKTNTVFRHRQSGDEIQALSHVRIRTSSDERGWRGLRLEIGSNHGWDVDDLMVDGHYIAINLAATPLHLETRNESDGASVYMPPLTFWINPEGRPFSVHHNQDSYWASCVIEGKFLDEILGRHYELNLGFGIVDPLLANLIQSLIASLNDEYLYSQKLADELIRAFVHALATRHGKPASELLIKGGIAPHQLNSLLSWLGEHLGNPLTVDDMASKVGLSAAHFSREFKRSTGLTPWGYVVQVRVEFARKLLEAGESVTAAALRAGFSDQSHLSRLFKLRFGVSPSAFVKAGQREKSAVAVDQ